MDCGDHPRFASQAEEILYLKNFVEKLMNENDALQREFDTFTAESQMLEKEQDATIEQNERRIKELEGYKLKLEKDKEMLKSKLEQSHIECEQLRNDRENLKEERVKLLATIRTLEQKNDDLERTERVIAESMATYEASLNQVIERNVILESEIEEKETLREKFQRLLDETRDLKQEISVRDRIPDKERSEDSKKELLNGSANSALTMDSNRLRVEIETQTTPLKRDKSAADAASVMNTPFSPSSRLLALNIISELMRKIGLLEAKLGHVKDCRSSNENVRKRHVSRGRSSPSFTNAIPK